MPDHLGLPLWVLTLDTEHGYEARRCHGHPATVHSIACPALPPVGGEVAAREMMVLDVEKQKPKKETGKRNRK